jgi:hypothetical protein
MRSYPAAQELPKCKFFLSLDVKTRHWTESGASQALRRIEPATKILG